MIALLLVGTTWAQEEPLRADPIEQALVEAVQRHTSGLRLGDQAPPIYHLRYHLMSLEQRDITAQFGHLVESEASPYRLLSVELRVGSPKFDNTGFGGWENGFASQWLPQRLTPHAVSLGAWRLTDGAYKQALEQFARKEAQFRPPPDYPGDYTLREAWTSRSPVPATAAAGELETLAAALSIPFAGKPGVEVGEVHVGHEIGTHTIVDSGGQRIVRPVAETSIRALIHVRAADGMLLTDSLLWTVRVPEDLPAKSEMVNEVEQMTERLLALAKAPVLEEEVVGPIVLTDGAAVDLFRHLLLPQLEGTPQEVPFESFIGDLGGASSSPVRLGRRVLPPGWTVIDDPTANPAHPGSYTVDYEGTPAAPVTAVVDGIVRDVLMSRVPRREKSASNGHARGSLRQRLAGRSSITEVTPARSLPEKKVHRAALKLAAAYGRDWYIQIGKLQEPSVRTWDQDIDESEGALPRPLAIVRRYTDGRTETLRGGQFSGVERFVLRDIVAAGPMAEASYFLPPDPGDGLYTPTGGLPAFLRAPEVLIGEVELVPTPPDPNDAPVLPFPR